MRSFIILFFLCNCYAYGSKVTGIVVDSETNEPLFGVSVYYGGVPVAFSDDEGRFTLTLDKIKLQDTVLLHHMSYYNQMVVVNRLRTDPVVRMDSRFFSLAEVRIKPVNQKQIIKDIVAQFQKTAPVKPYWTKIHQTQTLTLKGEVGGYVEYTGHILCMGRDITNAFIENQWIPEYVRRTRENPYISNMMSDIHRDRISERLIDFVWLDYRFFDVAHPLGKFHNHYTFRLDSFFTVEEKDYIAISYKQKKRIEINLWSLNDCNGQLCVEKGSKTLVKMSGNTNRDNFNVTQLTIEYGNFNHRVVPREIKMSVISNQNEKKEKLQDKLLIESCISFTEAADRQGENYSGDYNAIMPDMLIQDFPYEPEYWTQFAEKRNMDFAEGAKLSIYKNLYSGDDEIQYYQLFLRKNMPIIKNEISKLTWEKIISLQ